MEQPLPRNIKLIYGSNLASGFMFFLPILALYLQNNLLTTSHVAIIFAVEAFAMAVFEIPTGAIADLFGRKNAIVLDYIITLLAILILFIGNSMPMFILYAILNALAWSLASGSESALVYDTLKEEGREKEYLKMVSRMYALWPFGAGFAALLGGYLAHFSLKLPIILTLIPMLIGMILVLFIREPSYHRSDHRNILKQMKESLATSLKNSQLLLIFIGGIFLWGLSEITHNLGPLFFEFHSLPITYFGVVTAAIFLLSSVGHLLAYPIGRIIGTKYTAVLSIFAMGLTLFFSTITTGVLTMIIFSLRSLPFGIYNPAIEDIIQHQVESSQRATIMSINNLMTRIGIATFAPIIGHFADLYTINTAFKMSAIGLMIVPIIFMFLKNTPPHRDTVPAPSELQL